MEANDWYLDKRKARDEDAYNDLLEDLEFSEVDEYEDLIDSYGFSDMDLVDILGDLNDKN